MLGTGRRNAAHHLRRRVYGEVRAAWIDALGRHRQEKVGAGAQATLFEHRLQHFAGRARIGGRFEHDGVALAEVACDSSGGRADSAKVGLAVLGQWRWHADQNRVGVSQLGLVGRAGQLAFVDEASEIARVDVFDVRIARIEARHLARVWVEAHHGAPRFCETNCERKTDVAGSDNCDITLHGEDGTAGVARAAAAARQKDGRTLVEQGAGDAFGRVSIAVQRRPSGRCRGV